MRHYGYTTLLALLLLALVFRIAVPPGFMPAPVSGHGSTWLVPCSSNATSAEWLAAMGDAQSHHEHEEDRDTHAAFETCAFGAFSSLTPSNEIIIPGVPTATVIRAEAIPEYPLYRAPYPRAGETRAPPV
ncbi:MAG: DUF2946 family protein [Pseudomonadota bacterium]